MSRSRDLDEHDILRDEAIDTGRYVAAIRRSALPIVAVVVLWTLGTWAWSLFLPPTYESRGEIIVTASQGAPAGASDSEAVNREMATLQSLVTSTSVLAPAAEQFGTTVDDLRERVAASIESQTSILVVTARRGTAEGAQDLADAVVDALIEQRRELERARLENSVEDLSAEIIALESAATFDPLQRDALVERRAELTAAAATAGDNLQAVQEAELPSEPASPRPLRNAAIAFFGSLAVAVLLAVARDRFRPPPPTAAPGGSEAASPAASSPTATAGRMPASAAGSPQVGNGNGATRGGAAAHPPAPEVPSPSS